MHCVPRAQTTLLSSKEGPNPTRTQAKHGHPDLSGPETPERGPEVGLLPPVPRPRLPRPAGVTPSFWKMGLVPLRTRWGRTVLSYRPRPRGGLGTVNRSGLRGRGCHRGPWCRTRPAPPRRRSPPTPKGTHGVCVEEMRYHGWTRGRGEVQEYKGSVSVFVWTSPHSRAWGRTGRDKGDGSVKDFGATEGRLPLRGGWGSSDPGTRPDVLPGDCGGSRKTLGPSRPSRSFLAPPPASTVRRRENDWELPRTHRSPTPGRTESGTPIIATRGV